MIVLADGQRVASRIVYRLHCTECKRYVGDIDSKELQHIMSGQYGRVVCFDCEARWVELFGFSPNGPEVITQ